MSNHRPRGTADSTSSCNRIQSLSLSTCEAHAGQTLFIGDIDSSICDLKDVSKNRYLLTTPIYLDFIHKPQRRRTVI